MSGPLEWSALWAAMDAQPEAWIETTESMYRQMLECLPPAEFCGSGFLVGEPKTHNAQGEAVHACFRKVGGTYRARHITFSQFRSME